MAGETTRSTPPWKIHTYKYIPDEHAPREQLARQIASLAGIAHVRELLDSTFDIIFILNSNWQIAYANRRLMEAIGAADKSSVLGRRPGEVLNCVHAAECSGICGQSRACGVCGGVLANTSGLMGQEKSAACHMSRLVAGRRESFEYQVESTPFSHDGEHYTIITLADTSGEKRRKQYEEYFLQDILREAYALDSYAYQLRNELPRPERPASLDLVSEQISRLVDHILAQHDLVKAEKGALSTTFTRLVPYDFVYSLVKEYKARADQQGVEIEIDPCMAGCLFYSDAALLHRVLGNLLMNAIEATDPGGLVTLSAALSGTGESLVFSVHNAGVMPEDVQVQVFDRSFSTKSPSRGLGAYTARLLSESYLGGAVDFRSDEESGTTFFVEIPLGRY